MAIQEVIIKFKADTSEISSEIKGIEQELRKADQAKIDPISDDAVANIKEASKATQELGKATDSTTAKTKSLKAQLKEMKAELAALEASGKGNTARFREVSAAAGQLEDQIGDVNARVKALASDTPRLDALISAATGIAGGFSVAQGAVALFGDENEELNKALLKVQAAMAITNGLQAVAQTLNKDSAFSVLGLGKAQLFLNTAMNAFPLVFIVTALAAVAGGLFLLFTNQKKAADGILEFSKNIGIMGRVALGLATLGLSELVFSVSELSKAFRSNEEAAHDAAVTAASEFLASTQKQIDAIQKTREAVQGRYDFEIRLAKATGKETAQLERDKLNALIKSLDEEYKIRLAQAERVRATLIDEGVGATAALKKFSDQQASDLKKSLQEQKENLIIFNAEQTKAEEDRAKEAVAKAKENREKALKDKLDALDRERKEAEKLILETAATEEQINKERNEADVKLIQGRIAVLAEFGQDLINEEIALLNKLNDIENSALEDEKKRKEKLKEENEKQIEAQKKLDDELIAVMEEGEEKKRAVRIKQFEDKIAELEEQGILTAELEKGLQKQLIDDLNKLREEEDKANRERIAKDLELRRQQVQQGLDIFATGVKGVQDLIKAVAVDQEQAAEFQKTLAVFQIGIELAKSLANVITAATQQVVATGGASLPLLLPFIVQGFAAIFGAFAQVRALAEQPAPKFAKGVEWLEGAGTATSDSIPAYLSRGERVVPAHINDKYYDELSAIQNGYFEKLIAIKYIAPLLSAPNQSGGMNDGIMGSLMLNGKWKGENIVDVLNRGSKQGKKQHKDMMKALRPQRINKRKF